MMKIKETPFGDYELYLPRQYLVDSVGAEAERAIILDWVEDNALSFSRLTHDYVEVGNGKSTIAWRVVFREYAEALHCQLRFADGVG